jgi:hypothetical protein
LQDFDERTELGKPSCFADPERAIWLVRGVRRAFLYDETSRSDNSHTDTSRNSGAYLYSIMSWLTTCYTKDMAVDDGALIWKSGDQAGIYATMLRPVIGDRRDYRAAQDYY